MEQLTRSIAQINREAHLGGTHLAQASRSGARTVERPAGRTGHLALDRVGRRRTMMLAGAEPSTYLRLNSVAWPARFPHSLPRSWGPCQFIASRPLMPLVQ